MIEYSIRGSTPNGLVLDCECDLTAGQMDASCFIVYWSGIQMVGLVHRTKHMTDHLKSEFQEVGFSNVSRIHMVGIQIPKGILRMGYHKV